MGTYQILHRGLLLAQQIRNTFYYITTVGEPSASEFQDMADEIRADWVAELQANLSTQYKIQGITYRRVDVAGLPSFELAFGAGQGTGTSGTDPLPTQIAMLVSNKGVTAKPRNARSYLAGFVETDVLLSLFTSASRGNAEDFIDLQSNLNTGGTNPLSRVAAQWNTARTLVEATNDLSGAVSVASAVPATQRRRRIGVGI